MVNAPLPIDLVLTYRPGAERHSPDDGAGRAYIGSGDGEAHGSGFRGSVRWDLFEHQGPVVCDARLLGVIDTDDGARIGFEAVGLFRRPSPGSVVWTLTAGLRLSSDDNRFAGLQDSPAFLSGTFDASTYVHHYVASASVP